jgi:N-methylhydantoinase B
VRTRARSLVEGRWNAGGGGGRVKCPPWGLWGGQPAKTAKTLVKGVSEPEFHPHQGGGRFAGPAGNEVMYLTAGGGGYGDPLEREPDRVLRDVTEGYISLSAARGDYGVVLTDDGRSVDTVATNELRGALRAESRKESPHPSD